MKNVFFILILTLTMCCKCYSQQYYQLYFNEELQSYVTANHAARLGSEHLYQKSYQKQIDQMDRVKESTVKVVMMKELIFKQLKNVNGALKQGKKIQYIYSDFEKLITNMGKMITLTAENPEYAVLITPIYEKLYQRAIISYEKIADEITREQNDYLMDTYDRHQLLYMIALELRVMNNWVVHINLCINRARKKTYWKNFKVLNRWYVKDKHLIKRIINDSGKFN